MFYGNLNGLTDPANYRFDGPRGVVGSSRAAAWRSCAMTNPHLRSGSVSTSG